jgi:archaellum component FlaC
MQNKFQEQVGTLHSMLKSERDEAKNLRKKLQLLEADLKKNGRRKPSDSSSAAELQDQVEKLRREAATAERLAKASDVQLKGKDAQLKRAVETVNRLKQQVAQVRTFWLYHTCEGFALQ